MATDTDIPSWLNGYEAGLQAVQSTRFSSLVTVLSPALSAVSALIALSVFTYTVYKNHYYHMYRLRLVICQVMGSGNTVSKEPIVQVTYPDPLPAIEIAVVFVNEGTDSQTIRGVVINVPRGGTSVSPYPHVILPGKSLTYLIPMSFDTFRRAARLSPRRTATCVVVVSYFNKKGDLAEKRFEVGEAYFEEKQLNDSGGMGYRSIDGPQFTTLL